MFHLDLYDCTFTGRPYHRVCARNIGRLTFTHAGDFTMTDLAAPLDETLLREAVTTVLARELGEITAEAPPKRMYQNDEDEIIVHDWVIVRPGELRYRLVFARALANELNARLGQDTSPLHQVLVVQDGERPDVGHLDLAA
jgi:hypothetical protein